MSSHSRFRLRDSGMRARTHSNAIVVAVALELRAPWLWVRRKTRTDNLASGSIIVID
jgi:hypothetical protein